METAEITQMLLAAKAEKGLTFSDLERIIGRDKIWIAALFYHQASASKEEINKLAAALGLAPEVLEELSVYPTKGSFSTIPADPMVYRFYEIIQVYGLALKAVIQEQFGDGIMSAVDFTMDVEREKDAKGDRVKLTMSGKFLPYKKW